MIDVWKLLNAFGKWEISTLYWADSKYMKPIAHIIYHSEESRRHVVRIQAGNERGLYTHNLGYLDWESIVELRVCPIIIFISSSSSCSSSSGGGGGGGGSSSSSSSSCSSSSSSSSSSSRKTVLLILHKCQKNTMHKP